MRLNETPIFIIISIAIAIASFIFYDLRFWRLLLYRNDIGSTRGGDGNGNGSWSGSGRSGDGDGWLHCVGGDRFGDVALEAIVFGWRSARPERTVKPIRYFLLHHLMVRFLYGSNFIRFRFRVPLVFALLFFLLLFCSSVRLDASKIVSREVESDSPVT